MQRRPPFVRRGAIVGAAAALVGACAAPAPPAGKPVEGMSVVDDLQVVDCLLPGQVRQLGKMTYLTQRRPIMTTAADCRIRGGEYVAYDRADYKSALNVWLPTAESGDPEAQANVGEIFERGLGSQPNYEMAAFWYRKAAEQGNRRAQFNLATLYEQGLGMPEDRLEALNWYRQAWGIQADDVMFRSMADAELQQMRGELEGELEEKERQIELLEKQLSELERDLTAQEQKAQSSTDPKESAEFQAMSDQLATLSSLISNLQAEKAQRQSQLKQLALPTQSQREAATEFLTRRPDVPAIDPVYVHDKNLGRYFALIIGNQDYQHLDDLESPLNDARRAREILESKYGFQVTVIPDADQERVMRAVNELNDVLTEQDNLLIYYSGHGARLQSGAVESGYWLPVDAEPPPRDTYWVSTEFVTRHLSRIKARRILVVADSCYAGLLSDDPGILLIGSNMDIQRLLNVKVDRKSRLLLSAGGDSPLPAHHGGTHSVFAEAFLRELEDNNDVLTGPSLYVNVLQRLEDEYGVEGLPQEPELKVIKGAGHEAGDFFLVPSGAGG